jgi:hypothetical protein
LPTTCGNPFMGIVYPSKAVARRWDGALQARLRRAPLESFLRARSVVPAPAGPSQDTDNLVRAAVLIVEAGLDRYRAGRDDGLAIPEQSAVGLAACLVSLALAQQFSQADSWRVVALVSSAKLLSRWVGLNAAAMVAAAAARQFQQDVNQGISPLDWRVMRSACASVTCNSADEMANTAVAIVARLNAEPASRETWASHEMREIIKRKLRQETR